MKPTRLLPLLAGSLAALSTASAVHFTILQNTTALNTAGAWQNATVPGTGDVLLWNNTYTTPGLATTLSQLGGDLSISGLKVTNVAGATAAANVANTMVGFQNTSSANTLTIGADGIEMSTATHALLIQSKVTIGANQTWNLRNANTNANPTGGNNGEDISFTAQGLGAFNFGGKTVNTTGTGQITITSGYTLSNGTLNIGNNLIVIQGGSNRLTTVNSDLNINVATGSTLRFQSNSGAISSAAPITLNGGTLVFLSNNATNTVVQSGNVTVASASTIAVTSANTSATTFSGNLLGSASLALNNTAGANTRLLQMAGNNSGYSGTITLGGTADRYTRLTNANAGSAAATWSVSAGHTLQLHNVSPTLGTLNGAGTVSTSLAGTSTLSVGAGAFSGVLANGTGTLALAKTTAGILTLSGANSYTGATSVSQGTLLLTTGQPFTSAVTVADGATFGANVSVPGTTVALPSLSLGTTTGATLEINTGILGNPTLAPLAPTSLDVPAPTVLKVTGSNLTAGSFPAVAFTSATGTGNLSLLLPPRHNGSLIVNGGDVSVNIASVEQIRWNGDVNTTWDTSIPNWKTTVTDSSTAYIQTAAGSDIVNLTDAAAGTGPVTVNLGATLTPIGLNASNATRDYTLAGSGKLSGSMTIAKTGAAALIVANTAANDFTGTTTVTEGSLVLGNGATAGAGSIAGPIVNNATLVLNRPDDFTFGNTLTGTGALQKDQTNTVSATTANLATQSSILLNGGKLALSGAGILSGEISGPGQFETSLGTVQLNGTAANTNTGLTTVSGGILQLNKTGVNAVGGDITVTGTGQVALTSGGEQIADTATFTHLGTSVNSLDVAVGLPAETIANVVVNSSVAGDPGGQVVMRNGMNVTGTGTITRGILGVASGNTANVNAIVITATNTTDAILRIPGNSAASVFNVGPGGITASGGLIQVKYNGNAFDSTLNLGGDFTTTGNVVITNGSLNHAVINVINLLGERTFNIGAGTTTTVQPDLGDTGSLVKSGAGTLVLESFCAAAHTGGSTVSAGALIVNGTIGDVVADGATAVLGGNTASATPTVGNVNVSTGATVSPGNAGLGRMLLNNVTLAAAGQILVEASAPTTRHNGAAGTYDALNVAGNLTLDGTFTLAAISGYTPALGDSLDLWDAATVVATAFNVATDLVLPALAPGLAWDTSTFATDGVVTVINDDPVVGYAGSYGLTGNDALPAADPDGDGISNAIEYAFQTEPTLNNGPEYRGIAATNGSGALTLAYRRPVGGGVPGVTYGVEFKTTDLDAGNTGWTAGTLGVNYTQNIVNNGNGTETVTITINDPVSGKKFARVAVTY